MSNPVDIMIVGTGAFAARILFDLVATADVATRVAVAGRNEQRLAWLGTAARARVHMYRRPVTIETCVAQPSEHDEICSLLSRMKPAVVLQAASLQAGSVIAAQRNAWSKLVAAGGLSASAVIQSMLSARVARACAETVPGARFINACFPDVVNTIIAALGLKVTCGIGNIQILAHCFGGTLAPSDTRDLKLLSHYQNLGAWRLQPSERSGANARVWLDDKEIGDVFERFHAVQLTPEPVIDISGAAAAPLMLALAHRRAWRGHVPGPEGLPGGYPVRVDDGRLQLDLPSGLTRAAAVHWNSAHEAAGGLVVNGDGSVRYAGRLHEELYAVSPSIAAGFHVRDLDANFAAMQNLRERLLAIPG